MNENVIVWQVRATNAHGKQRVVHAYTTEADAQVAIKMMKKGPLALRHGLRYTAVPVQNIPNAHWGINFPDPANPKNKKLKK